MKEGSFIEETDMLQHKDMCTVLLNEVWTKRKVRGCVEWLREEVS